MSISTLAQSEEVLSREQRYCGKYSTTNKVRTKLQDTLVYCVKLAIDHQNKAKMTHI